MAQAEPIAIVGMAGRFPGADNIEEFWANLVAGRDCLTELSDEELLRYHEDPELIARPDYVRRRPIISDADAIDAELFELTPREAELRDPQYRLMLETAHSVLEHAGYDPADYQGRIGLFAATNVNRYRYDYIERDEDLVESVGYTAIDVATSPDYLSTFISYKLNLRGPSATVLTACSSSLMAVHMACTAIRAGDCEMVIAGGVDIEFPYHRGYVPMAGGLAAHDGVVRSFDVDGAGTNFGDGVGAVLLKPLSAALRDNDTVYSVILGSAINNDGSRKVGFTAPSIVGQSECVRDALAASGITPGDIGYVEAHGTATKVGDPIELTALIEAYQKAAPEPLPTQYCGLGSVKSNIGHLGQAAGIAGLIKASLVLSRRLIPPSINVSTPTPETDWENSPFYLNTRLREWPDDGRPRRAGVSSFGIGGTNAHVVLQEAPPAEPETERVRPREILTWSARTDLAETALRERLAGHFERLDARRFADTAHTLRVGRTRLPVRAALLAAGPADAAAGLRDPARVRTWDGVIRDTVFAFPGQGAQRPGMFRHLYETEPMFRQGCDAAFEVLGPLLDRDLRALWLSAAEPDELAETEVAQPLLYVGEYTLAHCLMQWGVTPVTLVGHSLGELVAAAVAGVFDFETGLRAVAARARCIQRMPRGSMLAVSASMEAVAGLLPHDVTLAAVNAPAQIVLAGPGDVIADLAQKLAAQEIGTKILNTSHAFHSPAMAQAAEEFEAALSAMTLTAPTTRVISAETGAELGPDEATSAAFWARQLVRPVDFDAAARVVFAEGPANVLEIGPGATLAAVLRGRSDFRSSASRLLPVTGRGDDEGVLEETLARLWVDGVPVTYWRQDERRYRRVAVPGYPYQRRRAWIDRKPAAEEAQEKAAPEAVRRAPAGDPAPALAGQAVPAPDVRRWRFAELHWVRQALPPSPGRVAGRGVAVMLAPGDETAARAAQAALQLGGYRTRRVADRRAPGASGPGAIDPTVEEDWLSAIGRAEGEVVLTHAAMLDPVDHVDADGLERQVAQDLDAVRGMLKAAAVFQRHHRVPTRVLVLARGMVDVTGGEPVNPVRAAVMGLIRSAAQELPAIRFQLVDVSAKASERTLGEVVVGEPPLAAVRGAACWVPRLVTGSPEGTESRLRRRGTYVITGGLGGLGLVVARAMAETGLRPNLVLLGRTPLSRLQNRDDVAAELAAITDSGAEVQVHECDVADVAALGAVVDAAEKRFGRIDGVVHAAGTPGGGLVERRSGAELREVLRPKAGGVLAIEEVFADRAPLDFLVSFSSVAGLTGMYGSADYAAANAFLDAHSTDRRSDERFTVSVQWPGWAEVGMLARSPEGRAVHGGLLADPSSGPAPVLEVVRRPGHDWEFDDHLFQGVPVLPGTSLLQLAVLGAQSVNERAWPVEIRDLAFLAPLVGDGPRRVEVHLRPSPGGHRVVVRSRPEQGRGPWTEHATGLVVGAQPVEAEGLDHLRGRLTEPVDIRLAEWITFGPRWPSLSEGRASEGERLVRLVLPERFHDDLSAHPVHPALVDAAGGVLHTLPPGRAYAPFLYRRVVALEPLTGDVHVHGRATTGAQVAGALDFHIYDSRTGALLFYAESFTIREVKDGAFAAPGRGEEVAGRPTALLTPQEAADPPTGLLTPQEGAAAFLELLRQDLSPVVLVDLVDAPVEAPGLPPAGGPSVVLRAGAASDGDQRYTDALPKAPEAERSGEERADQRDEPQDEQIEPVLRGLWAAALGLEKIGGQEDFFELGGNSLTAVQLVARINARFGTQLGAGALFEFSTLEALASELTQLAEAEGRSGA
ncbi:type I polyketide synthase [Sphaerisporangium fuscum]|uniref:type I polyketide synthase n=1 Tax=Sphaerisporangium fuscum TaxID=2835868 RepID=UPI001BDD4275|nr:type I polyketide synthase [Sphaerisporangium fuscum]